MTTPSGRISSKAPFSVNRDSSMEIAKIVFAIMEESIETGIWFVASGIWGSSGKLSLDIPAIFVRDRPQVMLAQ